VKVSEWLRQYQLTGQIPDDADDPLIPFWAGWLIGASRRSGQILAPLPGVPVEVQEVALKDAREMAIRAAEFIETHAKG
jgi:hypothetical protein